MFSAIVYVACAVAVWLTSKRHYEGGRVSLNEALMSSIFWPYFLTNVILCIFAMLLNGSDDEEAEAAASWGNAVLWVVGILQFLLGA